MQMCYGCMQEYDSDEKMICPNCGYASDTPPVYEDCLYPGTVLGGRYTVGRVIGRGGFGITYMALDTNTGKRVVVKEYLPEGYAVREFGQQTVTYTIDAETYMTCLRNAVEGSRAISDHESLESIENFIDVVDENNTAYIVRDYYEGETIKDYVEKKGTFDYQKTVETIIPVLRSISILHSKGFVHGNINPDSIILCEGGGVKLVDFGLKAISPAALRTGFAPKEQYSNILGVNERTDIYSVCAVIYYMLTGIVPADSRLRGTEEDQFIPLCGSGFINESVEDMIMKGMSVAEEERNITADDVADALIMRKKAEPTPVVPVNPVPEVEENKPSNQPQVSRSKRRRSRFYKKYRPAIIGFSSAVAVLLVAIIILLIVVNPFSGKNSTPGEKTGPINYEDGENTANAVFTPKEANAKYSAFLDDDSFKEKYPEAYAVRTHNIEIFPSGSDLPDGLDSLDYGFVSPNYYDIDLDGTNELIYSVVLDSTMKYVNIYIFDIDADGNVFEGGSIPYKSGTAENINLCAEKANDLTHYYFIRYTGSAYEGKSTNRQSFECLYYDGKKLLCGASGGQNKKITDDNGLSSLAAYCITGTCNESDGRIWNPTSPSEVGSVYVYDDDNYVTATEGFTVIDGSKFSQIWSKYVTSAEHKCELVKNLGAMSDETISFTVSFKGPKTGEDIELIWVIGDEQIPFLYEGSGRDIVYTDEVTADEFGGEYKVSLYVGDQVYQSCTIALDLDGDPVYHYGDIELAYLPNLSGKLATTAQIELIQAGFTNVSTASGSIVGVANVTKIGRVERTSPESGQFYPADTAIVLYIYV